MPKLNKRERFLALGFGGILFVVGNFILLNWALNTLESFHSEILALEAQVRDTRLWIDDRDYWNERLAYLDGLQPHFETEAKTSSDLTKLVASSAEKHQVEILSQNMVEPAFLPGEQVVVSAKFRVKASFENLCRWLHELQQPDRFLAFDQFALRSDNKPPEVICDAVLSRHYNQEPTP